MGFLRKTARLLHEALEKETDGRPVVVFLDMNPAARPAVTEADAAEETPATTAAVVEAPVAA